MFSFIVVACLCVAVKMWINPGLCFQFSWSLVAMPQPHLGMKVCGRLLAFQNTFLVLPITLNSSARSIASRREMAVNKIWETQYKGGNLFCSQHCPSHDWILWPFLYHTAKVHFIPSLDLSVIFYPLYNNLENTHFFKHTCNLFSL